MKRIKMLCVLLIVILFISDISIHINAMDNISLANNVEDYEAYDIIEGNIEEFFITENEDESVSVEVKTLANNTTQSIVFNCNLNKFGTDQMLTYNKLVGNEISSNNEILNFSICFSNDLFSPEYILNNNEALVKLVYVNLEDEQIISCKKRI